MMKPIQGIKALEAIVVVESENVRPAIVDDSLKELCYSLISSGVLQPPSVVDDGDRLRLIIGFRRVAALNWGASQGLAVPDPIPVMIYPASITLGEIKIIQMTENLMRVDLTDLQLYQAVVELEKLGLPRKEIGLKLGVSPASATRYFAPSSLDEEELAHFLAGRLSLGQCYKLITVENRAAVLAAFLAGKTHEGAERAARPRSQDPKGRTDRVKIPLAVHTNDLTANGVVSICGLPGEEIDLDGARDLLAEALKAIKEAKQKNWTMKTAMKAWRDSASAV